MGTLESIKRQNEAATRITRAECRKPEYRAGLNYCARCGVRRDKHKVFTAHDCLPGHNDLQRK
jgi:hypothetical protein